MRSEVGRVKVELRSFVKVEAIIDEGLVVFVDEISEERSDLPDYVEHLIHKKNSREIRRKIERFRLGSSIPDRNLRS